MLMDNASLLSWNNLPEYTLESFWYLDFPTGNGSVSAKSYFTDYLWDNAIDEVNIPQSELEIEKTTFGLPIFSSYTSPSTITISYYDYVNSTNGPMPITHFFQDWLDKIYDRKNHCLLQKWRREGKQIDAYLLHFFNSENQSKSEAKTEITESQMDIPQVNFNEINKKKLIKYTMYDCYPTKINEISLSNGSGDRMKFSVEIECSRVDSSFGG